MVVVEVIGASRTTTGAASFEKTRDRLKQILAAKKHVVTANKKPLATRQEFYKQMTETAAKNRAQFRYEATVGAGLPIIDTIDKLKESGDQIEVILASLSGTIGYIMTQVEDGVPFSQAVEKARELGYTEPDPRDDLSGIDVARKTLILARTLGHELNLSDITVEPLYQPSADSDDPAQFIKNLEASNQELTDRVERARQEDKVLRYIARIHGREASVKLEEVDRESPMGRLRGLDNQVTVTTKRYSFHPLSIIGPGAGAEVTASGVLNDIQKVINTAITH